MFTIVSILFLLMSLSQYLHMRWVDKQMNRMNGALIAVAIELANIADEYQELENK